MKHLTLSLCLAITLFSFKNTFCQEKSPVKFGKISATDFDLSKYNFDTSVSAVVISDIGSSSFEGNRKGWFSLIFKHQLRMKILKKSAFEAATITIPLYSNGGDEEIISSLQAITYNLENGNVVKSELDEKAIFKDKLSKNVVEKKFTFPAVKEGSIIEYSYTIHSDFLFNLQPWTFQGEYPRLWSEYNVSIPEFFNYVTLSQGYLSYNLKTQNSTYNSFAVIIPGGSESDRHVSISGNVYENRWVIKDVPKLKEEAFTTTLRNHIAKIEFQLSQYRFPDMTQDIMGNWITVSDKMMKREDFGLDINKNNGWLDDDMKRVVGGISSPLQKAKLIYEYVRDNFTCTDHSDLYLNNTLKTVFKNKNGSVSDINLLLVAMLHHENIQADPVILSTRAHGFTNDVYPLMSRYNYVIAQATVNDNRYYLDASDPFIAFDKLPERCYNGYGRIISTQPLLVAFPADSLKETKMTNVFIVPEKGKIEGSFQTTLGYNESLNTRESIKEKGEAAYFKKIKSSYTSDIEMKNTGIDSLKMIENPVSIHYDFKMNDMEGDIIYFNPMLSEGYDKNLFKAAERKYPVEMPYTFDETYNLNMDIPAGYVIDEIPKSAKVSFNDGEGFFEYLISSSANNIQLRSRIVMSRANFAPEEYNSLRDFFGYVVKKHSEQIVLKKKK